MKRIALVLLALSVLAPARAQQDPELARQFLRCSFYLVNYGKLVTDPRQLESVKAKVTLFSAVGAVKASSAKFVEEELVPAGSYVAAELQQLPQADLQGFLLQRDQECTALLREHRQAYFAR